MSRFAFEANALARACTSILHSCREDKKKSAARGAYKPRKSIARKKRRYIPIMSCNLLSRAVQECYQTRSRALQLLPAPARESGLFLARAHLFPPPSRPPRFISRSETCFGVARSVYRYCCIARRPAIRISRAIFARSCRRLRACASERIYAGAYIIERCDRGGGAWRIAATPRRWVSTRSASFDLGLSYMRAFSSRERGCAPGFFFLRGGWPRRETINAVSY